MKKKFLSLWCSVMAAAYLGSTSAALAVTAPEAVVSVYGFFGSGALFRITSLSPPVTHVTLGGAPQDVAITPDDSEAWVTDNQSFTVSVIDLASNTVLATIPVGQRPAGIAITPDGKEAWVANFNANTLSVINIASRSVTVSIPVGINPAYLAFTTDGKQAWVCNFGDNTVTIIDTASRLPVGSPIPVGLGPFDIAMTPDGTQAWVTNNSGSTISVIETAPPHGVSSIAVGNNPAGVAITPDGTQAWVYVTGLPSDQLTVIDVASQSVISHVSGSTGQFIAFSPDGTEAWTTGDTTDLVYEYNRSSETLVQTLSLSNRTRGIAVTPDQAPTARFTATSNGIVVSLDASASSSPYGTIATYAWDFGDGSPVQKVTVPQITYSYAKVGTFTVTLTVTNTQGTSTTQTFTGKTVSNNGGPSAQSSQQITLDFAPPKFIGKSKIHYHHKKIFIKTKWKPSHSSTVASYKIAGRHRTRAIIPATHKLKYKLRLHPQHKPRKYLSRKKYKRYLEHKYSIRAISANGAVSTPTFLHIVH